nr:hypothetical protein I308_06618 [Cryptococcus tetragattii IND107]
MPFHWFCMVGVCALAGGEEAVTGENSLPTSPLQLSLYPTSTTMMPLLKGYWQEGLLATEEKRKLLNSWLHRTWYVLFTLVSFSSVERPPGNFQHYISTRAAFMEWYDESKAIRMGHATGLLDLIRTYTALIEALISREDGHKA